MKLCKTLLIILIVSFSISVSFSQNTGEDAVDNGVVNTGNNEKSSEGNSADLYEKKSEGQNDAVNSGKGENKINSVKKQKTDKTAKNIQNVDITASELANSGNEDNSDNDLLLFINEGNYKYKRIPDIKLVEKEPAMAEQNKQGDSGISSDDLQSAGDKGFLGLSKNTADIVAKGGILVLILAIFAIYKIRSKGHGRRSSSSKVMKSFRK